MIITIDSVSDSQSTIKIASQLQFLFSKLGIDCQTVADKHISNTEQLEAQLLNYNTNKILLLLSMENKADIKSEMIINSHLLCTFLDNFHADIDKIATSQDKNYEVVKPGSYSSFIWEQKKLRAEYTKRTFNWYIYKNYSAILSKGSLSSENILRKISRKIGCKVQQGVTNLGALESFNLFKNQDLNIHQLVAKQEIINIAKSFGSKKVDNKLSTQRL